MRIGTRALPVIVLATILIFITMNYFVTGSSQEPVRTTDIEALLTDAEKAHNEGRYGDAIAVYEEAMSLYPNDTRPYLRAAHTYRYWGKYEESEQLFLRAVAMSPTDPWPLIDLGKLYRNMGRFADAEQAFFKSIELDPSREEAYGYGLGYLYLEMERYSEAESMFRKALAIDPKSDLALSGIADVYRVQGKYEESERAYEAVFAQYPHSEAYVGYAWLLIQQGRYEDAVAPLEAFLKYIREKGEVYYALGIAHQGAGDLDAAERALMEAVRLNPETEKFRQVLEQLRAAKP